MPRFSASDFIDSELAVRHALSAPVWAKPIFNGFLSAAKARIVEVATTPTISDLSNEVNFIRVGRKERRGMMERKAKEKELCETPQTRNCPSTVPSSEEAKRARSRRTQEAGGRLSGFCKVGH